MPCASPRPAVPKAGRRRANAARWNAFRAAAAQATLRKTTTFVACHRVHAKKRPISFPKRTMLTFPEQKRRTKHHAQANAAEKHAGPHGSGNGRAGRTLDRWGTCAGDRKRPLRTGRTLDGEGSGNSSLSARPREGRRLFIRPSRKITTGDRAQGERPAFPKRTMPRRFRLSAGATGATAGPRWRSGPFCAMLRLRRSAARNAEEQPPGRAQTPRGAPARTSQRSFRRTVCSRSPAPAPATPAPEAADKACSTGRDHGRKQEEISLPARRAIQPCGAVQNALRGNGLPPHGSDLRKGRLHRYRILVPGIVPLVEGQRARMGQKVAHKKVGSPLRCGPRQFSPVLFLFFSLPPFCPTSFRLPGSSEAKRRNVSEKSFFYAPGTPQRCPRLTDDVKAIFPTPRTL